ncbi:hypothetical protein PoB_001849400 [Plakobranchus ocellatus]|uniref:Uncharacterized protein n=1 Tax=Plakobranchus ocellatus TaxID=259542 RepID=A0AAV3ZDM8_9GAST|nr:hypothetical protein PoB_001849400 [Plakobranchus ocellatus]
MFLTFDLFLTSSSTPGVDQTLEDGSGLLHLAVLAQNATSVQYLVQARVSPRIRDRRGQGVGDGIRTRISGEKSHAVFSSGSLAAVPPKRKMYKRR